MRTAVTIITFTDAREGVLREIGDVFTAEDERAAELEEKGFVKLEPKKSSTKRKK